MGGLGQRIIFELRNAIFNKIQQLPLAFFNENKAGDLISRVNNDTDKLSQFFSQALMQFISNIVIMIGAGIFLLVINPELGLAALVPAVFILLFTKLVSPWIKKKNALNLKSTGSMSAEIQESLNNFKVIIAFNRRDYFRKRFDLANQQNYKTAVGAGLANNIFLPVFGLLSSFARNCTVFWYLPDHARKFYHRFIGQLPFLCYKLYNPCAQLAALWTSFQVALAGWDRISQILSLNSNLVTISYDDTVDPTDAVLEFRTYIWLSGGYEILHNISFAMERGKTYALVGPTGVVKQLQPH